MTKYLYLATLIIGFVLGIGFSEIKISKLKADQALVLKDLAEKTAAAERTLNEYNTAIQNQFNSIRKANYEHTQAIQTQNASALAARDAYIKRLRNLYANSKNTGFSTSARSSGPSKSDQATFDMFTQMLDRHTTELVEVGKYADELRAAGLMCEQMSDPLPPAHTH